MQKIDQHDIWYVTFDPTVGQEIQKARPALVLSGSEYNRGSGTIFVVPLTSQKPPEYAQALFVGVKATKANGLALDSYAHVGQIRSVSKLRFTKKIGIQVPKTKEDVLKVFLRVTKTDVLEMRYFGG